MEAPRNISDRFTGWTTDLIKERLRAEAFPYAVLMEHLVGDFNLSTFVRNSNAFNSEGLFYHGIRKWDKRGAVGTNHYSSLIHLPTWEDVVELKKKYTFVAMECNVTSVPMSTFEWPDNPLIVFGEEGNGISEPMLALCDHVVHIEMFGSVRSLNVGTSSGIAMNDFVTKYNRKHGPK